jgi:hypothetical protein
VTRPLLIGSSPVTKTMGIVGVAALAACAATLLPTMNGHRTAQQLGHEPRQPIQTIVRPSILDGHVLALDESAFVQTLTECRHEMRERRGWRAPQKPDRRRCRLLGLDGERHAQEGDGQDDGAEGMWPHASAPLKSR